MINELLILLSKKLDFGEQDVLGMEGLGQGVLNYVKLDYNYDFFFFQNNIRFWRLDYTKLGNAQLGQVVLGWFMLGMVRSSKNMIFRIYFAFRTTEGFGRYIMLSQASKAWLGSVVQDWFMLGKVRPRINKVGFIYDLF